MPLSQGTSRKLEFIVRRMQFLLQNLTMQDREVKFGIGQWHKVDKGRPHVSMPEYCLRTFCLSAGRIYRTCKLPAIQLL